MPHRWSYARIMGRAALLRHRAGFLDAPPPYSTHDLIAACFPDVRVIGADLPDGVIEMAEARPDRRAIFYSRKVDFPMQRLGIVHGLGHFLADLRRQTGISECNIGLRNLEAIGRLPTDPIERTCDLLAAEILVPLDVLDGRAPHDLFPAGAVAEAAFTDLVDELASTFKVPRSLMRDRLWDLKLLRATTFWLSPDGD